MTSHNLKTLVTAALDRREECAFAFVALVVPLSVFAQFAY